MEHLPHTFVEKLRSVTLTKHEREAMRAALLSKMRETGIRPVPSPWSHLFFSRHMQVGFLSMVIVMSYASSVAFAAEGALPGDILYPIKTKVAEPVVRLVTVSTPADEATYETKLLERRLEEAETLTQDKKLDTELEKEVRENVRTQSAKAKMKIKVVEEDDDTFVIATFPVATSTSVVATTTPKVKIEKVREEKRFEKNNESVVKERGKSKRELNAVLEKHERTLERLDLEDEKVEVSDKNDRNNENRGNDKKERHDRD